MNDPATRTPQATTAADLMTPDPRILRLENTLQDAAVLMRELDIGALFVVDRDRLGGVITDRDIALRGAGEGFEPITTTVAYAMSRDVVHVREDAKLDDILETMANRRIRRVAVTDAAGRLRGVVSLADIVCAFPDYLPTLAAIARIDQPFSPAKQPEPDDRTANAEDAKPSERGGDAGGADAPLANPPDTRDAR